MPLGWKRSRWGLFRRLRCRFAVVRKNGVLAKTQRSQRGCVSDPSRVQSRVFVGQAPPLATLSCDFVRLRSMGVPPMTRQSRARCPCYDRRENALLTAEGRYASRFTLHARRVSVGRFEDDGAEVDRLPGVSDRLDRQLGRALLDFDRAELDGFEGLVAACARDLGGELLVAYGDLEFAAFGRGWRWSPSRRSGRPCPP